MTFYFVMINAWSLAWEALYGDMDKEYPIIDTSVGAGNTAFAHGIDGHYEIDDDGLDYEIDLSNLIDGASADYEMTDIDDQYSHHFSNANSPYNDGWTQEFHQKQLEELKMSAHYFKYHEKEILKDIEEYVSRTYQGHNTGNSHEFRNVQTLDLMAAKELASGFCQANILKYGSRYGNKDGKNTKDLMKVIHLSLIHI